ncbi:MAG: hypothetical protein JNL89_03450 [Rhodanobacteraceae bacterium]|nr:hypothetical protein [Rhodanobacteraceae bacterium]
MPQSITQQVESARDPNTRDGPALRRATGCNAPALPLGNPERPVAVQLGMAQAMPHLM